MARKRAKSKRLVPCLLLALLLLGAAAMLLIRFFGRQESSSEPPTTESETVIVPIEAPEVENTTFGDGIVTVEKVNRYAGIFSEDGSDEIVSDIFAITVRNHAEKMLQYARIAITCGGESYTFDMSTIPAGARAQVLEKERKKLPADLSGAKVELVNLAEFQEEPSLHADVFALETEPYSIRVKNISDTAVSGDVYVYYKTKVGDLYMGGITYRIRVTDLAPGEQKTAYAGHYNGDSEILFVTYVR